MAIQSYNESYLHYVSDNLGTMLVYAVNSGADYSVFWNYFINSNVARQIEKGNPKYLTCSAIDYISEINKNLIIQNDTEISKNCFFWAGWILAQYQYHLGLSFYKINEKLPIDTVISLYNTLHEADVTKFFEIADTYFKNNNSITNLKKIRLARGLSQTELSRIAKVDLRSIQMYEQKRNDINKAQAETLYKISIALSCNIEDLLEF